MNTYRTLVVDDESIVRERLIRMLGEFEGLFSVIAEAKNGIEGVALINQLKPDVVFLDIQMPGKMGLKCLNVLMTYLKSYFVRLTKNMLCKRLILWLSTISLSL